jgi:glucose/arabinose dehydrogenase
VLVAAALGAGVVIVLAGLGAGIACTKTSLDCHLRSGPDLSRTSGKVSLPDGFTAEVVAEDLDVPTDFAFLPDGRVLVAERSGLVRIFDEGKPAARPLLDIRDRVNDALWRGLIGLAVDPDFERNGFVYVLYTARRKGTSHDDAEPTHVLLVRHTVRDDRAQDERVLLGADGEAVGSCAELPVDADCLPSEHDHIGGDIVFAGDGTMLVGTGDGGGEERVEETAFTAQDVDALGGKILRIDREGRGLASNPFYDGDSEANRSKVWALGLRNPFRLTLTTSGTPVVGEVGWLDADEVNVVPAGANLGWPCYEGVEQTPEYQSTVRCQELYAAGGELLQPVIVIEFSGGSSVTGGAFLSSVEYPEEYRGYVYGDWANSWLRVADLDPATGELVGGERDLAEDAGGPVAAAVGPDGRLYYLALNYAALYRIDYSD